MLVHSQYKSPILICPQVVVWGNGHSKAWLPLSLRLMLPCRKADFEGSRQRVESSAATRFPFMGGVLIFGDSSCDRGADL
jgi:hypothetical protein